MIWVLTRGNGSGIMPRKTKQNTSVLTLRHRSVRSIISLEFRVIYCARMEVCAHFNFENLTGFGGVWSSAVMKCKSTRR